MSFDSFLTFFGDLEICHVTATSAEEGRHKEYEVFRFNGFWTKGKTAGGCGNDGFDSYSMNPQYFIDLTDPDPFDADDRCPVVVSLAQQQMERKEEHSIGFKIYKCSGGEKKLSELFLKRNNSVRFF